MPNEPQYWLMTGDTPTGPFTAAQIRERLIAGTATWQARACRVGESSWVPLVNIPDLGPMPVSNTLTITEANFKEIVTGDTLAVVNFWTPSCYKSQEVASRIERVADLFKGQVRIGTLNADDHPEIVRRYNASPIPRILMFKSSETPILETFGDVSFDELRKMILDGQVAERGPSELQRDNDNTFRAISCVVGSAILGAVLAFIGDANPNAKGLLKICSLFAMVGPFFSAVLCSVFGYAVYWERYKRGKYEAEHRN